jgi:hypothetical protein
LWLVEDPQTQNLLCFKCMCHVPCVRAQVLGNDSNKTKFDSE